jgi:hypothetical protein
VIKRLSRRPGILHGSLLTLVCLSPAAHAGAAGCAGTVEGSVLGPVATPTIVSFDTAVSDAANPALFQQFIAGLRRAGVATANNGQGNTHLSLTFKVTQSATGSSGPTTGTYSDFSWVTGENAPSAQQFNIRGATLSLTAEATDIKSQSLAWIGTLKCTVMDADPNIVAEDLGNTVGRSIGRSKER